MHFDVLNINKSIGKNSPKKLEFCFFLSWLVFIFPNFSQYLFIFISFALLITIILSFLYICCHFLLIIITHYLID